MPEADARHAPGDGAPRTLIGLGASAGGVEALSALVGALPRDLDAAVFVVLHVSPVGTSVLADILDRAGPLPARAAVDGERIAPRHIYVAPPDRHLLLEDGVVRLSSGPRENGHRPAVDPTFRALAVHDGRCIGVILSGTRDDGTQGLAHIKAAGGTALVQDPQEAAYPGMVASAMANVDVDAVLSVAGLGVELARLTHDPPNMPTNPPPAPPVPDPTGDPDETSTRYTCPECGGHIHRERAGQVVRFLCEVGHAYSPESLDGEQATAVEGSLWTASRLLGDRRALLNEMAERAAARGHARSAAGFRAQAEEAHRAGEAVRALLESGRLRTAAAEEAA